MTVRADKEARARSDNIKNITKETKQHIDHIKKSGGYMSSRVANDFKELVLDDSYKDIHNKGWIYTSPDGGKTIRREPATRKWANHNKRSYVDGNPDYDDVSGVRLDKNSNSQQISFVEIFDRINNIEREERSLRNRFVDMDRNTQF